MAHEAVDLPFRAEYAKSSRASCKGCMTNILKDTLRLAIMIQIPNWYHFGCFWERAKVGVHTDIAHYDSLRWDDQQKIKDKILGGGEGNEEQAAATPKDDFSVEYAASSRAKCRGCDDKIEKGVVRISRKEIGFRGQPQDKWYHVTCFADEAGNLGFNYSADDLNGFGKLKPDDQKLVREKVGTGEGKRKKPKKENVQEAPKKEDNAEQKRLKEQSEKIWKMIDKLKTFPTKHRRELLEYNKQDMPSGESKVLDRLADCMVFGALKRCPECEDGQLVVAGDGYHCSGNVSGWTKCMYTTKKPKRKTFKIPEELAEIPVLEKYKCVITERVFSSNPAVSHGKPLKNMKFVLIGKNMTKTKDVLSKSIDYLGGKVVTQIDSSVTACISAKDDVDKMIKKVAEAKEANITVVSEDFVDDCKLKGDLVSAIKQYKIAPWGPEPETLVSKEQASAAEGKSGAKEKKAIRDDRIWTKSMPETIKMKIKGGAAVDPDSGLSHKAHVVEQKGRHLTAVLGLVDVVSGANSYYKLQVLEEDKSHRFYVYRSWGRVGTTIGGDKLAAMPKQEAIANFKAVYEEKSGNQWGQKTEFVKYPKKFYPLEMDYGQDKVEIAKLSANSSSKLPKSVQDLIRLIFDVEKLKQAMLEFEIDLKKMPLGKLSKKHIQSAYKVLTEAQELKTSGGSPTQFLDASNRFFTLIPHDFGMRKPPILDSEVLIKEKCEMLDNLLEIEIAYSMLSTDSGKADKDPIDAYYDKLKCKMEVLDKTAKEFNTVRDYVKNTHAATHSQYNLEITDVFKTKREGEAQRYKPFKQLHNRQLLWHGSRATNYAGILSQGLRIAPPEAPVTGYMFGKGLYFADMVSKSANYCCTSATNHTGLLLLCEVALGNMHEKKQAEMVTKLPKGKHSTKGLGRTMPDPKGKVTLPDGVEVPLGKPTESKIKDTSLLYNEYIVYDTAQVNIKYLLRCEFNYDLW